MRLGLPFYAPQRECKNGHFAPKRIANWACTSCEVTNDRRRKTKLVAERAEHAPKPAEPERVISRSAAQANGLPRYFTGMPCKRGHISPRLVQNKTCVACDSLRHREGPGAAKHKERTRRYYSANRARLLELCKAYVARNQDRVRAQRKTFRALNKDRLNAKIAEWAKANPTKRRAKEKAREGRERGAEGTFTAADIERILVAQKGRCAICRKPLNGQYHVDHIKPIARGGSNWPRNLQLLCPADNQSKHARDPIDWARSLGLLV